MAAPAAAPWEAAADDVVTVVTVLSTLKEQELEGAIANG